VKTTARTDDDRCPWSRANEWNIAYHDAEWGTPSHDDVRHFEFLVLEAAQAGLSWLTILKRRDGYRKAYRGFDPARVARFTARDVERLLKDDGIIRNGLKVKSSINNAQRFLEVQKEFGSFDAYLWNWTGGKPLINRWTEQKQIPPRTRLFLCRVHDHLLPPAGSRGGERSPGELLPVEGGAAVGTFAQC
jgi:DNA-3-methyladenine glycosylase I